MQVEDHKTQWSEAKIRWTNNPPGTNGTRHQHEHSNLPKQECWCPWGRGFVLRVPNLSMGTIMALRNEILKPGGYASVPHRVLESSKLAASDKLVYQVLLDYLGGNDSVWPSQATIARRTALSIRGVRRSVARLTEVGLVSCEIVAGTSNHYTFSAPEAVLNTTAEADTVSDLSQHGGGQADRTNPATLSVPPATLAGLSGHAGRTNPDKLSHDPLHLTTSPEPPQENTSVEPPHSPASGGQQPSAAKCETDTILSFLQGVREMNPAAESYATLLTTWINRNARCQTLTKSRLVYNF